MRSRNQLLVLLVSLATSVVFVACGGSGAAPGPKAAPTAALTAPTPAPTWLGGDYPKRSSLFGHGAASLAEGEESALAQAKEKAIGNVKAEVAILNQLVKTDHEEQVAEIITRYTTEDFNAIADASAESVVSKLVVVEEYTKKGDNGETLYVLFEIPIDDYFAELDASALPDEQKKRITDYRSTFTDNFLENMARR